MPVGSAFGTAATDFFCRAIGTGSRALVQLVHRPLQFTLVLAALALLLLYALSRTSWRPSRRFASRAGARGARRSRRRRASTSPKPGLMLGIGVLFIPITLLTTLLQALLVHGTDILGVETGGGTSGLLGFFVLAIGTALTLLGLGLAQAATARALVELDQGRPVGPLRAYVLAADSIRPLLGALLIATTVVSLLVGSLYLIPIAVWLAGRWALIAPSIELEDLGALAGLRRSRLLVRGAWLKVASLIVVGAALSIAARPRRRRVADPRDERAVLARQRDRRPDLHRDDAARRDHDGLRLLRPAGRRRARRAGRRLSCPRRSSSRAESSAAGLSS